MERLTLPLPARGVWLRVRSLLGPALERLGPEAGAWKIGGGTVLAARWHHRESIDLDLTVNAGTAMPALFAGPTNDFETQILQRGGSAVTVDRDRCTVRFSTGKLDLSALDPTPNAGHADALVDGEPAVALSTAQILCGKLQRATRSPVRDVFDVIVAGKLDPQALAIAANTRTGRELEAIAAAWRASNHVFAYNAPLDLNRVPPRFAAEMTSLGLRRRGSVDRRSLRTGEDLHRWQGRARGIEDPKWHRVDDHARARAHRRSVRGPWPESLPAAERRTPRPHPGRNARGMAGGKGVPARRRSRSGNVTLAAVAARFREAGRRRACCRAAAGGSPG